MHIAVGTIELLLLVAAIVAMLARRLHVPYSAGLVVAGIILSLVPALPKIQFSKELIFTVFLPPLIFEAALDISWKELRKNFLVIFTLATVGVLISACVTALGMRYIAGWEWVSALLFSILIAATDPISVIATFKEANVRGRLRFLIEAESLFNDGTAAVIFIVASGVFEGGSITPLAVTKTLLATVGGGIACGAIVAGGILLLAGRTEDHLVEITLTTVGAYGSFLFAQHFQFSGVLATLIAGLMLGNLGPLGALSEKGRDAVNSFWEYAGFVASSFTFLLIGMNGTRADLRRVWPTVLEAVLLVLVARAATVYLTLLPFSRSSFAVSLRTQHVLVWGGLRGALALALALGLPDAVPRRNEIITVTFAVVAFSIFIQGFTIAPVLRHLGELAPARKAT